MECLYCGEKLGLLSSKGRQFCNKKHQELWRQREAEMSIQRLKDAFGFASSPTAKSKQTTTSVLDPPSGHELPPAPEFTYDDPRGRALPPAPEFDYQDPRDPLVESPASRSIPEHPVENEGVFYCGPASDREAPPNAGFRAMDVAKGTLRVPFYVRRPEAAKKYFVEAEILALQAVGQRQGQFAEEFCVTSVDVCTTGQPGHSLPQPSLELRYKELLGKSAADPVRKLEFQAFPVASAALQPFATNLEEEEAKVYRSDRPQPVHERLSIPELRPLALNRQEPERGPVFRQDLEIIPASLERVAVPGHQPVVSATAPKALPVAFGRAMSAPPSCTFKALAASGSAPAQYTTPATIAFAVSTHRELGPRLQLQPREHAPVARLVRGLPTDACAPNPHTKSVTVVGGAAMHRELSPRLQLQPREHAPAAHRVPGTPPDACAPNPDTKSVTVVGGAAMHRELSPRLQLQPREHAPAARLVPGTPPDAFAPNPLRAKAMVFGVAEPCYDPRPAALRRREPKRQPVAKRVPEIIPASLPRLSPARPRAVLSAKAPRVRPNAPTRATFAPPPNCTFQALPTNPIAARALAGSALTLCIASPQNLGSPVQVHPRQLELPLSKALKTQAYAPNPERTETRAPRSVMRPAACEVRPMAVRQREAQSPAMVMPYPENIAAGIPRLAAPHLQPAVITKAPRALPVTIARRISALPCSTPNALATGLGAPAQHTRPVNQARANLPHHKLGPKVPIPRRRFDFPVGQAPSAALTIPSFAPKPKNIDAGAHRATEPVCELRPQASEVRPLAMRWRQSELWSAITECPNIIPPSLPRLAARYPQAAVRGDQRTPGVVMARRMSVLPDCIFRALAAGSFLHSPRTRSLTALCADIPGLDVRAIPIASRKHAFQTYEASSAALQEQIFALPSERSEAKSYGENGPIYEVRPPACEVRPMVLGRRGAQRQPVIARYPEILLADSTRSAAAQPQAAVSTAEPALQVTARSGTRALDSGTFQALTAGHCEPTTMHTRTATVEPICSMVDVAIRVLARDPRFVVPVSLLGAGSPSLDPVHSLHTPEFIRGRSQYRPACPARPVRSTGAYVPAARHPAFLKLPSRAAALCTANSICGFVPITVWTERTQVRNETALIARLVRGDAPPLSVPSASGPSKAKAAAQPALPSTGRGGRRSIPAGAKGELTWVADKVPWLPRQ